jgi:ATP adenylyltransferase
MLELGSSITAMGKAEEQYKSLVAFIETRMSMTHVYQPLLIKKLVESGGTATVRQLAQGVLAHDESQLLRYEAVIKRWPFKTLKRHGMIEVKDGLVKLSSGKLSLEQRSQVLALCEQKIGEFIAKHGLDLWDRQGLTGEVTRSRWYAVHKRDDWQCRSCGVRKDDQEFLARGPFHVDHIKPRSKGGASKMNNLQLLCARCNTTKGNRDDTDLRKQ